MNPYALEDVEIPGVVVGVGAKEKNTKTSDACDADPEFQALTCDVRSDAVRRGSDVIRRPCDVSDAASDANELDPTSAKSANAQFSPPPPGGATEMEVGRRPRPANSRHRMR